ncbi:T9SS type A sorting domain-containing protein [Cytophagaceae bacterium ABcell3]|nr:T9SS type A sorting domain-containing protein [Cytophagaceae bacterium ABcell3]
MLNRIKNIRYNTVRNDNAFSGEFREGVVTYSNDTIYEWWIPGGSYPVMQLFIFKNSAAIGNPQDSDLMTSYSFYKKKEVETGTNNSLRVDLAAFPNPASNEISFPGADRILSLTDCSGKTFPFDIISNDPVIRINLNVPPGIYIASVSSGNEVKPIKILIQ